MKVLIVYASSKGHTKKVAEFLQAEAERLNHKVTLEEVSGEGKSPDNYDAIIIASSIHVGQYNPLIVDYATRYKVLLNIVPSAFFSVGLYAARHDAKALEEVAKVTNTFLEVTKWKPFVIEQVAGALHYSKYGFFKKVIMKSIMKKAGGDTDTTRDYEYTNWDSLRAALSSFLDRTEALMVAS